MEILPPLISIICYLLHLLNLVHDTNLKYITTKLLLQTKSTTALQKNNPTNVDTTRQVLNLQYIIFW